MRHRLVRPFFVLLVVLGLGACTGTRLLNSITPDDGYNLASDIIFDPSSGLKLDVYRPTQGAGDAPVVVFLYGGRWTEGATKPKIEYRFVGQALAARGFVAVIPDYRVAPKVKFPTFVEDCAKALRWVHASIRSYGGDPGKLVLLGHSSGAYNAAMLTLDGDFLKGVGGDRTWLRGMIGLAGPYDFLPITDPDLRVLFGPPENFERTQPILYADGRNPPILLMAGQNDQVVSVKNTENLYDRIKRANGPVEKVIYPEMSHADIIADVAQRLQGRSDVIKYVAEFVQRVTRAPQSTQDSYGIQTIPQ